MTDPWAAPNAAGASIWPNDLSREGLEPEDPVRAKCADTERALGRIQGARIHYDALTAGLEHEGAAVFETARIALCKQLSARLSYLWRKHPEAG
jgi:hypothetical protein